MGTATKKRLGNIFLDRGLITTEQLEQALARQIETHGKLGEILVDLGFVSRGDLANVISEQWDELRVSGRRPLCAAAVDTSLAARLEALTAELALRDRRIAEQDATIAALRAQLESAAA